MKHYRLTAGIALIFLMPMTAPAQVAVQLEAGANAGVHGGLSERTGVQDASVGPVWALTMFPAHFGEPGRASRLGLRVETQLVDLVPELGADYATHFRQTGFLLEAERLVAGGERARLLLGAGVGFVARSDRNENEGWNYCESPFCDLPEFNWVLSPKVRGQVPVTRWLVLSAQVRGNLYTATAAETFPYKSGVSVLMGLEFQLEPGPGENRLPVTPEPDPVPLR